MRISEIYLSVQGEGPNVGRPTVFIRFAGCNLRCPGWPCDTPHAIFPEKYRKEWKTMSVEEITQEVVRLTENLTHFNVCLTGGEPFLQVHDDLYELVTGENGLVNANGLVDVECFSNGTLLYPDWALDHITFIMDWKLDGSGENPYSENRLKNLSRMGDKIDKVHAVKFVIKNRHDYEQAKDLYFQYIFTDRKLMDIEVFYGVVWNELTNSELISWVLADGMPWRLNVQVHNYIWDRRKRGI